MPRPTSQDTAAVGNDSFLDIVANIVGILIILVMVTGVRAKNWPAHAAQEERLHAAADAIEKDLAIERSLRQDVLKAAERIREFGLEMLVQNHHRDRLATMAAAWQHKIDEARQKLDTDQRADFELRRQLSDARADLDQVQRQRKLVETAQPETIVVESYPTPLSKTVDSDEAHFQLKGGRLAFIPLDELLEEFKGDAQRKAYKLFDLPELTDTVGPQGAFRLRYTLERHDVPVETQLATGQGSFARLKRWTLIPTSGQLGEPLEEALAEGSRLRAVLARYRPEETTVTIWTYPDSFAEFRRLKKELYRLGFPTAARPLPDGVPIGGSPEGTKSAAE